jgi:hypothetical protein
VLDPKSNLEQVHRLQNGRSTVLFQVNSLPAQLEVTVYCVSHVVWCGVRGCGVAPWCPTPCPAARLNEPLHSCCSHILFAVGLGRSFEENTLFRNSLVEGWWGSALGGTGGSRCTVRAGLVEPGAQRRVFLHLTPPTQPENLFGQKPIHTPQKLTTVPPGTTHSTQA